MSATPRGPAGRPLRALILGAVVACASCNGSWQQSLDDLAGKPSASSPVGATVQVAADIPSGPQLYCLTNIAHTLEVYRLQAQAVLPGSARYVDLDPVGPWFSGGRGYIISRVDSSGAGANALVEFAPQTLLETRRLNFPANSNPNSLLVLPGLPDVAWVAIRGSTFNSPYGPNAIAVVRNLTSAGSLSAQLVDLATLTGTAPGTYTSLLRFLWDDACPANGGQPCVYAIVNNFNGVLRQGALLVLTADGSGNPHLLAASDSIAPLGTNPLDDAFLDTARGQLWVVNNGGYAPVPPNAGSPTGTLQVLATARLGNGVAGDETLATLPAGFAPVGMFGAGPSGTDSAAWVSTYPSDAVLSVTLHDDPTLDSVNFSPGLPPWTGPLIRTQLPAPGLYAGRGGFGPAHLARLDPTTGQLLADVDLQAGNGPVTCAEHDVP